MHDTKERLSLFWIFALLNYLYADVLALYAFVGSPNSAPHLPPWALLGSAVLMEIPIAMIPACRLLPFRPNRLANIITGVVSASANACSKQLTPLGRNSASRNPCSLIGLRIVKRMDFFQFAVADMHAVADLVHAEDCLHFKDCCDKISLDNMLLDLDAFDGWQNTRQESDYSVPPDQLSYAWPLKGNIRGEGYFGYVLARQPSQIRLDNRDFFLSCHAFPRVR